MRIAYVANHDNGRNDEEGAIAHALSILGHDVVRLPEGRGHLAPAVKPDLVLFHKWLDIKTLRLLHWCPKVFWWFDLVDWHEPFLRAKLAPRREWMRTVLPYVDAGFLSDGNFVVRHRNDAKLHWLTQAADQRYACLGDPLPNVEEHPILFLGEDRHGPGRAKFLQEMRGYGDKFVHIRSGVHGRCLKDLIAGTKIVVCPDSPVSHHYWSNRIYLMLGYGACVLHPHCLDLHDHYSHDIHYVAYPAGDYGNLHSKIRYLLENPAHRKRLALAGLDRTREHHTYVHRCVELLDTLRVYKVL